MDSWTDESVSSPDEEPDAPPAAPLLQFYPSPHSEQVQRDIDRREQLRQEELQHLTELRDRIQEGIDKGVISLESGTEMLLNISKVRMSLAGVGVYPGAW